MVRADGIEPSTPAWKAGVLPLNYARLRKKQNKTEVGAFGQGESSRVVGYLQCLADLLMKDFRSHPKGARPH
jgi:hypothetical protein